MTPKQQTFVNEYLVDLNATQAAIRAGYSEKRAAEIGYQLLQKTTVSEAIQQAQAERAEKLGRSADDVLRDIQSLTREARNNNDLKTALRGLELEGKHLGMFREKVDLTSTEEQKITYVLRWQDSDDAQELEGLPIQDQMGGEHDSEKPGLVERSDAYSD